MCIAIENGTLNKKKYLMNNLTDKEVSQIITNTYTRGFFGGMLTVAILYGLHQIVLNLIS